MAILRVCASEYLGTTESGRSHPMRCLCEINGRHLEVYVKYKNFHEELSFDHLVSEVVANKFALELCLPAAEPCLVDISKDFLSLLPKDENGERIAQAFNFQSGVAFGSLAFSPVRRWSQSNLVHKGQTEAAVKLYLFDTIVENSDRGVRNPNLLVSGHDFKVIDFGHCFQRCHNGADYQDAAKPWQPHGILNHYHGDLQHVLYSGLTNVTAAMIEDFTKSLGGLSDDTIQSYVTIVPQEWGQDTACKIVDFLLDARENAAIFEARVKEVLL